MTVTDTPATTVPHDAPDAPSGSRLRTRDLSLGYDDRVVVARTGGGDVVMGKRLHQYLPFSCPSGAIDGARRTRDILARALPER